MYIYPYSSTNIPWIFNYIPLNPIKWWLNPIKSHHYPTTIQFNLGKLQYFTNLNCWAIWGWFPLLTMIPGFGRTGFGRYNLPGLMSTIGHLAMSNHGLMANYSWFMMWILMANSFLISGLWCLTYYMILLFMLKHQLLFGTDHQF